MVRMQGPKHSSPLILLGERLKQLRETRQESVAEVSGAVEIDIDMLERIERGEECPSEDILTLLISHFSLHEHEAVQLWEWAGFNRSSGLDNLNDLASKAALVLIAIDARIMYSDDMTLTSTKSGVVLNFMQTGPQGQPVPVSRVGMSYEQVEAVLNELQQALLRKKYLPGQRLLPPGDLQ